MKVLIVGGTGLIGYYTALEFLENGHKVTSLSFKDIDLGDWYPKKIKVHYGDVFKMTDNEYIKLFKGHDAIVYGIGPDDRFVPDAPAYDFFYDKLVMHPTRMAAAAKKAGVKKFVVLNSYFAYYHRLHPEKNLMERHPYIKCRVEQADSIIDTGGDEMDVCVLELPYIFGAMPERVPLWKDVVVDMLVSMKTVFYPKGGSIMISVENVAKAIYGAVMKGRHGTKYPIGDENKDWNSMLEIMLDALGTPKKIVNIPCFIVKLYGIKHKRDYAKQGKEMGLDPVKLMKDIQCEYLYYDADELSRKELGYGGGDLEESIRKTIDRCLEEYRKEGRAVK